MRLPASFRRLRMHFQVTRSRTSVKSARPEVPIAYVRSVPASYLPGIISMGEDLGVADVTTQMHSCSSYTVSRRNVPCTAVQCAARWRRNCHIANTQHAQNISTSQVYRRLNRVIPPHCFPPPRDAITHAPKPLTAPVTTWPHVAGSAADFNTRWRFCGRRCTAWAPCPVVLTWIWCWPGAAGMTRWNDERGLRFWLLSRKSPPSLLSSSPYNAAKPPDALFELVSHISQRYVGPPHMPTFLKTTLPQPWAVALFRSRPWSTVNSHIIDTRWPPIHNVSQFTFSARYTSSPRV